MKKLYLLKFDISDLELENAVKIKIDIALDGSILQLALSVNNNK